ncbi:hypothetical protein LXL04_014948 [Taraxacum kok-saghyz]
MLLRFPLHACSDDFHLYIYPPDFKWRCDWFRFHPNFKSIPTSQETQTIFQPWVRIGIISWQGNYAIGFDSIPISNGDAIGYRFQRAIRTSTTQNKKTSNPAHTGTLTLSLPDAGFTSDTHRFVFEAKTIQKMELLVLSFRFNFTFLTCKAVARSRIWKEEISYAFCT